MTDVHSAGMLRFERGSRSLLVEVEHVLAVVRTHVSTAEAAARLGLRTSAAWHHVNRLLGKQASVAGWERTQFDDRFGSDHRLPAARCAQPCGRTS